MLLVKNMSELQSKYISRCCGEPTYPYEDERCCSNCNQNINEPLKYVDNDTEYDEEDEDDD